MGLVQLKDKNNNQLLPLTTASGVKYNPSKSKLEAVSVLDAIDLTASKLNYKKVITSPCIKGYWRKTDVGAVGTVFNPAVYNYGNSISTNTRRTKIKVTEGDKIYIDHLYMATSSGPAWVIVDEDNVILKKATTSNYTNLVLAVPTNAKMVYILNDITHYATVEIYKYIAVPNEKDIDDGWKTLPYKTTRSVNNWILTEPVGKKFVFHSDGDVLYGIWYKVCPKDKIRLTMQVLPENIYSYYILGHNDIIIKAGEIPSDKMLVDEEFEVPIGGECLVFSTYPGSHIVKINRENENDVNLDYILKESTLLSLSESQNNESGERSRTAKKRLTLAWCSDTHDDRDNYRRFIDYVNGHQGIIDAVIHTGDMNRMSDTDYGFNNTVLEYRSVQPFLPVMGNHDSHGGATQTTEVLASGSLEWQANKYVVPFMDDNCVRGENDCYFYRDFDEYKIRIICLNDYDTPRWVNTANWITTTDENEISLAEPWVEGQEFPLNKVINYKGLYLKSKVDENTLSGLGDRYSYNANSPFAQFSCVGRYYLKKQVNWFINALKDPKLTEDWGIIIATHMPLEPFNKKGVSVGYKYLDKESNYKAVADNRYCLSPYISCWNGDSVEFYGGYDGKPVGIKLFDYSNSTYTGIKNITWDSEYKTEIISGGINRWRTYVRMPFLKDNIGAYIKVNGEKKFEWDGFSIIDENWQDKRAEFLGLKVNQDGYILTDILKAFLDRTTLNKTYHAIKPNNTPSSGVLIDDAARMPDVEVDVDFSETSAHIICCLNGHTHQAGCFKSTKISGHKVINLTMETSCYAPDSIAIPNGFFTRFCVSDIIRGGLSAKDCFNIISFDTENKYIYLMRIGADTTDTMVKRDFTQISYLDEV